jgi:hypothetical protein
VIEIPVFIPHWAYECCGEPLHVGDSVELHLTLFGEVTASDEPEQIVVLEDGLVRVVSHVVGPLTEADGFMGSGTLLQAGQLRMGVVDVLTSSRASCVGRIYEERHGTPAGRTSGRLTSIARRQVIWERTGESSYSFAGYGASVEIDATEEPMDPTPPIESPASSATGWVAYVGVAAKGDSGEEPIDVQPESWDYQLMLSIGS